MRVLLVNNLFQPEPNHLKGLAFAKELKRRGHDVRVLTGFPNYPGGRIYSGYRMRWTLEEELEGVAVTRVAMYPSHDGSTVRRIASYVSLGLSLAVHVPLLRTRFDLCHVYLGPMTLMWPAIAARSTMRARIVADVQDLWPESVTGSGMLRSRVAARVLGAWCRRLYRTADRIVVLSPGYKRALVERGIPEERIDVVYNWCDERADGGADDRDGILDPGVFNVVYAGNLGKLQGIDTLLDAAKRLAAAPEIRLVLAGEGVESDRLRRRIADERIGNVRMTGRLPVAQANAVQRRADLLVAHLQPTPLTRIGIPQKVQAYLASGAPILLAAEGDSVELLVKARAGVTCRPNDPGAMAESILRIARMSDAARAELGRNGARYYADELAFRRGVDRMERAFEDAVSGGRARA